MDEPPQVVFIVDDDASMRGALESLLRASGRRVETFASVDQFMRADRNDAPGCLLLDVRMPGEDGLELFDKLRAGGHLLPVVFMTGFADVATSVRAMKSGAVDFLSKPFDEDDLIQAIDTAMARGARARVRRDHIEEISAHYETLSERERQVFGRVVAGLPNKQIGAELGVTEKTVKVHRAHVMSKMRAGSLADLVRFAEHLFSASEAAAPDRSAANRYSSS